VVELLARRVLAEGGVVGVRRAVRREPGIPVALVAGDDLVLNRVDSSSAAVVAVVLDPARVVVVASSWSSVVVVRFDASSGGESSSPEHADATRTPQAATATSRGTPCALDRVAAASLFLSCRMSGLRG